MSQTLRNNQQVPVPGLDTQSESRWKRSVASVLGVMSIACLLMALLTTVGSICVHSFELFSGGSGGDDAMLIFVGFGRFGGTVLAFIGLAFGATSLLLLRCAEARLLSEFKWGLIGTAGCALNVAYSLHWFIYVISDMAHH